jgi:hypothetical protein
MPSFLVSVRRLGAGPHRCGSRSMPRGVASQLSAEWTRDQAGRGPLPSPAGQLDPSRTAGSLLCGTTVDDIACSLTVAVLSSTSNLEL